jgi:hypothetical protein
MKGIRTHAFCLLLLAPFAAADAFAWGRTGHRTIALAAEAELTPAARTGIARLLALEPGATLASISTWADEQRDRDTARWHFVNFPEATCAYVPARDCPGGACVVGAGQKQIGILQSAVGDAEKLAALKYVVHFVADVHQPLHAGRARDKGGNTVQLQAFGRGTNLHALWDTGLVEHLGLDEAALAAKLLTLPKPPASAAPARMLVEAAEESCAIANLPGFYPPRTVGENYVEWAAPHVMNRLRAAGSRLAELLNGVFHGCDRVGKTPHQRGNC